MAENTDTNNPKQMQLVQFIRNNVVLNSRKEAIQVVDDISRELNNSLKDKVKDGEPIIVRYRDEKGVIITYMAVVALKNDGTYVLSHVINDTDENSIRIITDSAITTVVSGLSGTIDSRIDQTFSSITSTVEDKTNDLNTKIEQTASGLSAISESVSEISRQMQDWSSITEDVQGKLSSVTTWYYEEKNNGQPSQPPSGTTEENLRSSGWTDNMDNIAAGEVWWTFTRYVYSNGNVVDTTISKMFVPKDGTTYYTWIKYSSAGTNSATVSDSPYDDDGNMYPYIGFAENQITSQESDNPKDYHWSLIKGQDGVSGKSGYMWVVYADELDLIDGDKAYPKTAYQQPTNNTVYIGILPNQDDANEIINTTDEKGKPWNAKYSWSKFKGDNGVTYTAYVWIKYADSDKPSDNEISDSNKKADGTYYSYIGYAYNKLKPENEDDNSKKASEYTWSPYTGNESIYTLIPLEADGLSALVKTDDKLHVKVHCAIAKKGGATIDKVTDKTFYVKIVDDKGKHTYVEAVNNGEISKVYDDYQTNYSSLNDSNQVTLLSVYLLASKTTAYENAYDARLISVGYSGGYFRKATQDYVEQNVSDIRGDITKLKQTSSDLSASIKDVSGNVNTLSATTQGLIGNIKDISGNVNTLSVTSQGLVGNIKDISGNVSTLSATTRGLEGRIADNEGNISQLSATSKGIESTVSNMKTSTGKNLFNFYSSQFGENVIPFIQGYGVGLNYSSSKKIYRISNLGFENQTGDYTVSFDAYCWGESKLNVNLCDVQANGYNGDSTVTLPSEKYTHYDFTFTIPESNTYAQTTSWNGFLDFENFDKNILIKNLNIIRGTLPSELTYSQKDINDIGSNQQYTGWTFNNDTTSTEMIDGMNRTVYAKSYTKTSGVTDVIYMNGITLKQGRSYTLSFYAKGQGNVLAYLYPHSLGVDFNCVEYPAVAGTTSKNLRSDCETLYKLDSTWRRFIIHFYNQSLEELNCICARIPENTDSFILYIADPVLEEGFITDTFDATKSLIRQSADEILEQVGDTYIKIGDGNITLNGSTQINGTLTLNNDAQGFLFVNGNNVCQISPKPLPSYLSFSHTASISRTYSTNWYEVDGRQNTATNLFFGYHFSDSIGNNFKVGDVITFGNLYHDMMTGRFGAGHTISNCYITFKVINANNVLFSVIQSNQTNIDIPNQTVKYDGNVSITVDIEATVANRIYYGSDTPTSSATPKAYVNWSLGVTTPTRNTYLQISPDGMAVNFGTNKNVYIGNDGFYANFGNYRFSITSDGIVGNNVHHTKVYTTSQTIPNDVDCAIFMGGKLSVTLPDSPYEGQTIKIGDKCESLYVISKKPVMGENSITAAFVTNHELPQGFWWQYIYCQGTWYEMVLGR